MFKKVLYFSSLTNSFSKQGFLSLNAILGFDIHLIISQRKYTL